MVFLFIWLLWTILSINSCIFDDILGLLCINENFNSDNLLIPDVGLTKGLYLLNLTKPTNLQSSPQNPVNQYMKFDSFLIEHSCVIGINPAFFVELGSIRKIHFNNVICLKHLYSESVRGLNEHLKKLILVTPDLETIEDDFFDNLNSLTSLIINKSKIKLLPSEIFFESKLTYVNVGWNELVTLPDYLDNTVTFSNNFIIEGNKFICDCRLKIYLKIIDNKEAFKTRCYNPPYLRGYTFCVIGDICNGTMTTSTKSSINTTSCSRSSLKSLTQETTNTTLNIDISTKKDSYKSHKMITKSPILFTQVSFSGNDYEYASVRWIVVYVIISVTLIVLFVGIGLVIFGFVSIKNHSRCSNSTPTKMFFSEETIYDELFV